MRPLVEAKGLTMEFGGPSFFAPRRRPVRAVAGVDLTIARGEALGRVGESGSGTSTIGWSARVTPQPGSGSVLVLPVSLPVASRSGTV